MTYPLLDSIRLSFFASDASGQESFVGLQNYVTLLTNELWSPRFGARRTTSSSFSSTFWCRTPSACSAALLSQATCVAATSFARPGLPTMLSFVIVGFIWQLILSPIWGISKGFLSFFGLDFSFSLAASRRRR